MDTERNAPGDIAHRLMVEAGRAGVAVEALPIDLSDPLVGDVLRVSRVLGIHPKELFA